MKSTIQWKPSGTDNGPPYLSLVATDEKQFVLFNYQHCDPLDQNAEIRVLTW